MSKSCKVCSSTLEKSFGAVILNKYDVDYFYCSNCGFLQTEEPYWLDEAYNSPIANADTGLVSRNVAISKRLSGLLTFFFNEKGKFLDVAGGYGILVRLMRDIGFDFYWSDPYCENLAAKGFEVSAAEPPFDAVTAFEVLEHVYDPLSFIEKAFRESKSSTIIFSTELFSGCPPTAESWYYYVFPTGQHISFYQHKTFEFIAKKMSLKFYSFGNFHMLTDKKISNKFLLKLLSTRFYILIGSYVKISMRSSSKTFPDHYKILKS